MTAVDPSHVYINDALAEVVKTSVTAVRQGKGVVVIAGAHGVGKTTLLHALAGWLAAVDDIVLACPQGVFSCSDKTTLDDVVAACRPLGDRGDNQTTTALLLVDDADQLDPSVLDGIKQWLRRDLSTNGTVAMIMTVPDRGRRTQRTEDQNLRAGTDLELKLPLLHASEVPAFVYHSLQATGHGQSEHFSPEALERVAFYGNGNAGRIMTLCNALIAEARRTGKLPITQDLVKNVAWCLFVPKRLRKLAKTHPPGDLNDPAAAFESEMADFPRDALATDEHAAFPPPPPAQSTNAVDEPLDIAGIDHAETATHDPSATTDASANPESTKGATPVRRLVRAIVIVALALLVGGAAGFTLVRSGAIRAGLLDATWDKSGAAGQTAVSAMAGWISDISDSIAGFSDDINELIRGGDADRKTDGDGRSDVGEHDAPSDGDKRPNAGEPMVAKADPASKPEPRASVPDLTPRPTSTPNNASEATAARTDTPSPPPVSQGARSSVEREADKPIAAVGETTVTEPSPQPETPATAEPRDRQQRTISTVDAEQLLARGDRMLELGDLASARLFYNVVAERDNGRAAMLMGVTYDPVYFRQRGIKGIQPEPEKAMKWYRRAKTMGDQEAEQRERVLWSWLNWRAETGDAAASRALNHLR